MAEGSRKGNEQMALALAMAMAMAMASLQN